MALAARGRPRGWGAGLHRLDRRLHVTSEPLELAFYGLATDLIVVYGGG